jgi:transmembrane sensor
MSRKKDLPSDFSGFLMDDEFIRLISDLENPLDYIEYINDLKKIYPDQVENIDLAVEVFFVMKSNHPETNHDQKQKIWNKIVAHGTKEKRMFLLRIAASFVMLIGLGGILFYLAGRNRQPVIESFAKTNKPTFEKSQLILSNGQNIPLSDYESNIKYSSNGENVVINDTTRVIQEVKAENFNQMIVPYGKYNSLQLSDGSKVWINSGSRLVYPPAFSGKTREVFLQGEAYFEVAKDASKPFYVKTDRFRVEVKGTRFSVQAKEKEELFTTLLLEGAVSLTTGSGKSASGSETKLNPGHLASLAEDGKNFKVSAVEHPENYIAWKNGYLLFDDEPVNELLKRVGRYYNIEIELRDSSHSLKISGKLDLKDDPERVLKGISTVAKCLLKSDMGKYIFY